MRHAHLLALLLLVPLALYLSGCGGSSDRAAEMSVSPQAAYTVTLSPVADTVLDSYEPFHNFGVAKNLQTGYFWLSGHDTTRVAMLRFDLSSLPAGATITKAHLLLYANFTAGYDFSARSYRVTKDWSETGATWLANQSFHGATPVSTLVVNDDTWARFNLLSLARSWYTTPERNFGVMIRGAEGGDWGREIYDSRESLTAARRPRLRIEYTL